MTLMEAVQDFPKGFFFIRCKAQPYALDVNGGSMINDATMIIWPQKMVDSINQLWMHEEGFLINKKSGLVIDIRGGNIEKEKLIIQYARKPGLAHNQRWIYKDGFISSSSAPHLVLDIRGSPEFKNGNTIFLNTKNINSITQQWIIQPFENEKSKAELALLRPSPHQRNTLFPRQEELYDCYRLVYLTIGSTVTPEQLAGAAAFKGMKMYIELLKQQNKTVMVNDESRRELTDIVHDEVLQTLQQKQVSSDNELISQAMMVAESYFIREYTIA